MLEPHALLLAVVDSSDDSIIGETLDGTITLWNRASKTLFGYSPADMIGRSIDLLIPPAQAAEQTRVMAAVRNGERLDHYETVRLRRDGVPIEVSLAVSPIRDSTGTIVGVAQVAREIGSQRLLERQALHLAALVDSSDDAIASKDLDGTVRSWNPAAERMFGYTASEMVGHSIRIIIPRDRWPEEDEVLRRVVLGERVDHFETIRQRKNGTFIPVSLTVSPIRSASGHVIGASKIARDISERTMLERETSRLSAIVNSSDDAIVSKDLNGLIQSWNQAAERMFGYTEAEAVGQPITIIIPEERLSEETEVIRRIRNGESVEHYDTVRRAKDGRPVPISLTVSPIRNREGTVIGASKIARDLSALSAYANTLENVVKQRTAALETANTQLESFAYSVSHDLRAPLRGMQGLAHALLEDYGSSLDERGRDYASRLIREAALLDGLIQDLLAYSRLTHIDVALESVNAREACDTALHNLREDIASRGATVDVSSDLPLVRGNRAVLVQIFTNLISNAVKFGGEHPAVRVFAERLGQHVRISVQDHGIGIALHHQERIFRAFERLHGVESYPGTGMGLAIVRKGVERLGGRVGVQSEEGCGSRFWVEIASAEAA